MTENTTPFPAISGQGGVFDELMRLATLVADTLLGGAHAAPKAGAQGIATVPSRHRLYNAVGGIGGWVIGRYLMNILVGETPQGKKIEAENVPFFLRPLHGILEYNRYADDPKSQWMRVIDDLAPAVVGSVGAVLGSKYFFLPTEQKYIDAVGWGTTHTDMASMLADDTIPTLAKDQFVALQQAKTWRVLSGVSGVFSASSGLALLAVPFNIFNYGVSLNNAFSLANGASPGGTIFNRLPFLKWIYNTTSNTPYGPALARETLVNNVSNCVAEMEKIGGTITAEGITAQNAGRIGELTNAIMRKLFPNITPEGVQAFKDEVNKAIQTAIDNAPKNAAGGPQEVAKYVQAELTNLLLDPQKSSAFTGFDTLLEKIGTAKLGELKLGNNGFAGWLGAHPKTAYAAAAGTLAAGVVATAAAGDTPSPAQGLVRNRARPPGSSAFAMTENTPQETAGGKFVNGPVLRFFRWLGDSVVAVPPQNRLFSAVGLTLGLWVGYRGMRALAGKDFNGTPLGDNAKIDPILQKAVGWLQRAGITLDFNYYLADAGDRIKRVVFWLVPTITGGIGTYLGSKFAFRKQYKDLENPEFLEDYTAKIALTQGDRWSILSSTAAVMASSSGFSNLPIPGLNYAVGLSTRSTLSYDKRTSMPILGKWWSNNQSNYYFGLRGALEHTIRYATRNPSDDPKELVALAEATLKPIFPTVTDEQIADYVNKIQDIRYKYWQADGIPENRQKDAEKELRGILRGAGFEKTLEAIGLTPADAVFENGVSGSIANAIGAKKDVTALAAEYREKYNARRVPPAETPHAVVAPGIVQATTNEGPAPLPAELPPESSPISSTFREKIQGKPRLSDLPPPETHALRAEHAKNLSAAMTGPA